MAFLGASGERNLRASIIAMAFVFMIALLLGGLRGREVDERATQSGGIRRSLRSSLIVSITGGGLTAMFMWESYGVGYGLCAGLTILITLWLWYGGYTVIQHQVLRALLRLEKHEYCDERYLDSAVDRALLLRVGGGCMFIHPLFMSHLAERSGTRRHAAS